MLQESLEKIAEIWNKECLKLVNPLSKKEISEKFANLKTPISKDVIEVYSNLDGMDNWGMDSTCFSFWEVDKIMAENQRNSEYIAFADFLIYSHLYYFKFENESVSSIHIDGKNRIEKIADSFEEFFENYINNPEEYYLFEREENKKEKKTLIQVLITFFK